MAEHDTFDDLIKEQEEKIDNLFEIKLLSPDDAKFALTEGGFLSLSYGGKEYPRVSIYKSFPFTDPNEFISIRDPKEKNAEIGMIRRLSDWPQDIVDILDSQINIRYFTPQVKKIKSLKEEFGFAYWDILSDRGEIKFTTSMYNPVIRLGGNHLLINDLDNNRYEIKDFTKLTRKEIKMIDLYL